MTEKVATFPKRESDPWSLTHGIPMSYARTKLAPFTDEFFPNATTFWAVHRTLSVFKTSQFFSALVWPERIPFQRTSSYGPCVYGQSSRFHLGCVSPFRYCNPDKCHLTFVRLPPSVLSSFAWSKTLRPVVPGNTPVVPHLILRQRHFLYPTHTHGKPFPSIPGFFDLFRPGSSPKSGRFFHP